MLDKYIDNLRNNIIEETCNLINIPSVSNETNNPKMPFDTGCQKALDYALSVGNKLGFRTKNIDNYCGYIEFGQGEKLVGLIGHLDVVPSGDGWNTPPFEATIKNGKIFGRGSIDDKGPVISSLFAMKAVKENLQIKSRVRLILGINEEKSWKCIEHYKKTEEHPSIGFSPDADFPCIYAEKGIATIYIEDNCLNYQNLPIRITNIDCKNNAINVVPKFCSIKLKIDLSKSNFDGIIDFIDNEIKNLGFDISYTVFENSIELISKGIQAHAAHPNLGKNAISQLLILLNRIYKKFNLNLHLFNFFEEHINSEYNGKSLNLNIQDESGALTLNVGNFILKNNKFKLGINLRIPVNTPILDIANSINKTCKNYNLETYIENKQEPLYIPKDNPLVQTLTGIFNKATNSNLEPIAIGGGTYARAFNNCVSFGANFPGDMDMCHQANEFVDIDKLILSCKIYAEAIYELAK